MALATMQMKCLSLSCTCNGAAQMQGRRAPVFSCPTLRQSGTSAAVIAAVTINARRAHNVIQTPKQMSGPAAARRAGCIKVPLLPALLSFSKTELCLIPLHAELCASLKSCRVYTVHQYQ